MRFVVELAAFQLLSDSALDDFEVLRGKRHISVSSGNRWWSCGVEGGQLGAVGRPGRQIVV